MCGRTCLTLEPKEIICACKYKAAKWFSDKNKNQLSKLDDSSITLGTKHEQIEKDSEAELDFLAPEWRSEFNCGRKYSPSYNIAPTDITPVLVSAEHFGDDAIDARVIVPMMWGMIPFWHKGDYRKHGLTTNNCRLEHLLESKLYRGPFQRGQRCVILCEGFYEWQTTKSAKPSERAAYLLHMPQKKGVNIYDKSTWSPKNFNLLKMAGLFDVWEDDNGDKIFSYSVITFESSKIMSWLHHRMPAILETEQQIDDWLDYKHTSNEKALSVLRPATQLEWYQVSNFVNSSRNKSDQCNKPISLCKIQKSTTSMNKTMLAWLNTRKRREEDTKSNEQSDDENNITGFTSEDENKPKRLKYLNYKKSKLSSPEK